MMKTLICVGALAGLVGLGACEDGSSEKAGESIDRALDKAVDGKENKGDGAFEKAGEGIDKVTGAKNKDGADSLSDAVDGNKGTKPN